MMAVASVETSWTLTGSTEVRVVEVRELLSSRRGPGALVLLTRALTVGRLAGLFTEQAETLVLHPAPWSRQGGATTRSRGRRGAWRRTPDAS